jgi:CheY-like chemotaxis protein
MKKTLLNNFRASSHSTTNSCGPSGASPTTSESLPEMRILIVENNQDHREILKTRLHSLGYVCQEAADGHEGLFALRYSRFDLVICDYRMPEMNGFQFIHTLRNIYDISTIPIIFTTSHSDRTVIDHAFSLGAITTLVKPYSLEHLKTALDLIGRRSGTHSPA